MVRTFVLIIGLSPLMVIGQDFKIGSVRQLNALVNSSCEEILPLVSPDGKTLYFVRSMCADNAGGKFAGSDIWVSNYDLSAGDWGRPGNLWGDMNDKMHNAVVGVGDAGQMVYLMNTSPSGRIEGIYYSKRIAASWTKPELVPVPNLNTEDFVGFHVSPDFEVIVISMRSPGSAADEDLYVSRKNGEGEWSEPRNLGQPINTPGFEIAPFLSLDKKRLYFSSNGHRGLGRGDIYYSDRLDDTWGKWSTPVNLGTEVNSDAFDAYFSISDTLVYFSSSRNSRFSNLYCGRIEVQSVDSTQLRIDKIVAEANTLLADIGDDTRDSLSTRLESMYIRFGHNSATKDDRVVDQLNEAIDLIRRQKFSKVSVLACYGSLKNGDDELSIKRTEVVKSYLDQIPEIKITIRLRKDMETDSCDKDSVEIRLTE
jgi:hypothetical protein